ncbi:MAG: hypothetical protein ACRBBK_02435 [Paracoccaceae bacterium]
MALWARLRVLRFSDEDGFARGDGFGLGLAALLIGWGLAAAPIGWGLYLGRVNGGFGYSAKTGAAQN